MDRIVDVPNPQILEETVEVDRGIPQEQVQECIVEQIVAVTSSLDPCVMCYSVTIASAYTFAGP